MAVVNRSKINKNTNKTDLRIVKTRILTSPMQKIKDRQKNLLNCLKVSFSAEAQCNFHTRKYLFLLPDHRQKINQQERHEESGGGQSRFSSTAGSLLFVL